VRRTVAWLDENGRIEPSGEDDLEERLIVAWRQAEEGFTLSTMIVGDEGQAGSP
jgi:hypothetical protein